MAVDMNKVVDLRSKCPHFRVLVIGRANAGKTTLLKKVCNSIDEPQIFSPAGKKIDLAIVEGSAARGLHDIENQLIFKSNPQFIFHDSRGFESGSIDEAKKVKDFIARRAGSNKLSEHLHAIWYCFPTDTNRPLLKADEDFFDTNVPGKVPLIAIFTKFDGLLTKAFNRLKANGSSRMEAKNLQAQRAQEILNTDFIAPLMSTKFCPSAYVRLDDMRKETSNCMDLIEKTANALTDDTLKLLFVSVQQNNIDLCIQFAVKAGVDTRANLVLPLQYILLFFPHIWKDEEYDNAADDTDSYYDLFANRPARDKFVRDMATCMQVLETIDPNLNDGVVRSQLRHAEMVAAICICAEQTFTEASARKQTFVAAFSKAVGVYAGSNQQIVNKAIAELARKDDLAQLVEIIKTHRLRIAE